MNEKDKYLNLIESFKISRVRPNDNDNKILFQRQEHRFIKAVRVLRGLK